MFDSDSKDRTFESCRARQEEAPENPAFSGALLEKSEDLFGKICIFDPFLTRTPIKRYPITHNPS